MAEENRTLCLKNYFFVDNPSRNIVSLGTWLANQLLHGKASRARTRFLKIINERSEEIAQERIKILEENSEKRIVKEKDKDGEEKEVEKVVYLDKDGKETISKVDGVSFKIKDLEKAGKELNDYLNEDYIIDVTPANKDTIYGVKEILLNTNEEFVGPQATIYDEICQAFESI